MSITPLHDQMTTRIIPGLSAQYQIVALPYWAWFWLEDFMQQHRISYQGIFETFGQSEDVSTTLHNLAELHQEYSMREVYNLSNDNELQDEDYITQLHVPRTYKKVKETKLPKIYKLFGFMPCATTLDAVWRRRNYEESNKIN